MLSVMFHSSKIAVHVLLILHNYNSKLARETSLVIMHGGPYFPERVPILPVEWGLGVPNLMGSPKFYDTGTVTIFMAAYSHLLLLPTSLYPCFQIYDPLSAPQYYLESY